MPRRNLYVAFDLKAARKARGLNQSQTANILCTTQPVVSRWEARGDMPQIVRKAWTLHWELEGMKHDEKETNTTAVPTNKMEKVGTSDSRLQSRSNRRVVGRHRRSAGHTGTKSGTTIEMAGVESAPDEDAGS